MTPERIVFLGMRCEFSRLVLEALLRAGQTLTAVIIPSPAGAFPAPEAGLERVPPPALPMLPTDLVGLAHFAGLLVFTAGRLRAPAVLAGLAALRPDVLCVACFPRRLPAEWLAAPRRGALNVHPSRLPAYRGPEPLFWQFRMGEPRPGVTVHQLDAGLDTGPIVAQVETPFADGLTLSEAERLTAQAGGWLLAEALRRAEFAGHPQPEEGASYYPRPTAADLRVDADWQARRAFNFMRGAEAWGPFAVAGPAGGWRAAAAVEWRPAEAERPAPPTGHVWAELAAGAVLLRLA